MPQKAPELLNPFLHHSRLSQVQARWEGPAVCPPTPRGHSAHLSPRTSPAPVGPNHSRSVPGPGFRQALSLGGYGHPAASLSPFPGEKTEARKAGRVVQRHSLGCRFHSFTQSLTGQSALSSTTCQAPSRVLGTQPSSLTRARGAPSQKTKHPNSKGDLQVLKTGPGDGQSQGPRGASPRGALP